MIDDLYADKDRHGNVRFYFWRGKGHKKTRIHEPPGSPEFIARYSELMNGDFPAPKKQVSRAKLSDGFAPNLSSLPSLPGLAFEPNTRAAPSLNRAVKNLSGRVTPRSLQTSPWTGCRLMPWKFSGIGRATSWERPTIES